MKKQNDRLREELKKINIFLSQAIEKQTLKQNKNNVPFSKDLKDGFHIYSINRYHQAGNAKCQQTNRHVQKRNQNTQIQN
jgi:hypothetical protein